jgi:phosphoribosylaminoimidazolecarboxamide formyltransferase/IMP cyclohydrolase
MKTLSFPVCSGILYRRGDAQDEKDLKTLGFEAIDCVVVNFYPFEKAAEKLGISQKDLIEEIDIGGPTLVRAAAKNSPDVLVLTDPSQYAQAISELEREGGVSDTFALECAREAWVKIAAYDGAIESRMSRDLLNLRYGENPHQKGRLEIAPNSPIEWNGGLTPNELSYNNITDLTAAYALASDLKKAWPTSQSVVIVKHGNPCGVAVSHASQIEALEKAWAGDPVSAFGGVLVFSHPLESDAASFLAEKFVELIGAPGLRTGSLELETILKKRKKLKAVSILRFGEMPKEVSMRVPGARLVQSADLIAEENLKAVTKAVFSDKQKNLAQFALVSAFAHGFQLVGAGQGQPNRIEALKQLAIPRALSTLGGDSRALGDCIMVSDAFFPFRDTVDECAKAGIKFIVQPGGSIKDQESIAACDEHGVAMVFTGVRHFKH